MPLKKGKRKGALGARCEFIGSPTNVVSLIYTLGKVHNLYLASFISIGPILKWTYLGSIKIRTPGHPNLNVGQTR